MEERPLSHRLAALLALLVLGVAGGVSAWWIYTDQVDFRRAAGRPAAEAEAPAHPAP